YPLAKPTADDLRHDQIVFQEVLRRLCVDSGACVVITDQIAAKGEEEREENELGRVLPMTASGLEYFVDVMLELEVRVEGFETVRVARVVKSNAPAFPVGMEVKDPTFADLLAAMGEGPKPVEPPAPVAAAPEPEPAGPTLDDLLAAAERDGLDRAQLAVAGRHYCGTADLERLAEAQLAALLVRMHARYGAPSAGDGAATDAEAVVKAAKRRKAA